MKGYLMVKNTKKTSKKTNKLNLLKLILPIIITFLGGLGITLTINQGEKGKVNVEIKYSKEIPYAAEGEADQYVIEEIDGGGYFAENEIDIKGLDGEVYRELGAIEDVDTSSPEAFKNSVFGKCIIANNIYGAQCVSLARAFWWSYAGFDVSTCGTGLAKGMMNCTDENARDKFKVIWNVDEIQDGTWIVLDGATTGHICMAMGKVTNGYVSCLGENQGGVSCGSGVGGSATNIIKLSVKNFIGGYTPVDYIIPEPEPVPVTPDTGIIK